MFFLVYVSSATRPFSGEDLRVLLVTCRKDNTELGVKGMLLYKDGNFMQVLEGEEGAVRGLYERIAADPATAARSPCSRASPKGASSQTGPWVFATRPRRQPRGPAAARAGRRGPCGTKSELLTRTSAPTASLLPPAATRAISTRSRAVPLKPRRPGPTGLARKVLRVSYVTPRREVSPF